MLLNNDGNMAKFLGLGFKIKITGSNWPYNCTEIKPEIWKIAPRNSKMQYTISITFGNNLHHNTTQRYYTQINVDLGNEFQVQEKVWWLF